jgi:hypothetical protein
MNVFTFRPETVYVWTGIWPSSETLFVIQTCRVEKHMGIERWQLSRNGLDSYKFIVILSGRDTVFKRPQVCCYTSLLAVWHSTMQNYPGFVRNAPHVFVCHLMEVSGKLTAMALLWARRWLGIGIAGEIVSRNCVLNEKIGCWWF